MYLNNSGLNDGSQLLTLGECVANLEDAIVGQSYDIAWPCLVDGRLTLSHKLCG